MSRLRGFLFDDSGSGGFLFGLYTQPFGVDLERDADAQLRRWIISGVDLNPCLLRDEQQQQWNHDDARREDDCV